MIHHKIVLALILLAAFLAGMFIVGPHDGEAKRGTYITAH